MIAIEQTLKRLTEASKSRLEFWAGFLCAIHAEQAMEIGVWKGEFAAHMLAHCESLREYSLVDPWRNLAAWNKPWNVDDQQFEQVLQDALKATDFAQHKRKLLRGRTLEVIDSVPDRSLDFVYIDGDHTLRGITTDLISVYGKVKQGGYVGGDDFVPSIWKHGTRFEPTLVCPFAAYFAEAVGAPFFALPFDQFLIVKPVGARAHTFTELAGKSRSLALRDQLTFGTQLAATFKRMF